MRSQLLYLPEICRLTPQRFSLAGVSFMDFLAVVSAMPSLSCSVFLSRPFPGLLYISILGLLAKKLLSFFSFFFFHLMHRVIYFLTRTLSFASLYKYKKLLWFSLKQRAISLGFSTFDSQGISASFDTTIFLFI
uniref:Uncharacterized protein n=1 Tax=Rousettus aegyptiacus TaxID=9407 RepID=A0A7J8C2Q5_ROUAE|nr:hypothetical protein HJG63_009420 [Rousettus aegyptiacus]